MFAETLYLLTPGALDNNFLILAIKLTKGWLLKGTQMIIYLLFLRPPSKYNILRNSSWIYFVVECCSLKYFFECLKLARSS